MGFNKNHTLANTLLTIIDVLSAVMLAVTMKMFGVFFDVRNHCFMIYISHTHIYCNRIVAHNPPALFLKFLPSSSHKHGSKSVSKDTEIPLLQDGKTVRWVTIRVQPSTLMSLIMSESSYSLLPYFFA